MNMEGSYDSSCNGEAGNESLQIIKYSPYKPCTMISLSSPWFVLRVFYVRVCGIQVDESTPEFLSLNHIPLSPDTLLEVNGVRSSIYSDGEESSVLRRDRVDKKSEEATFVNTDSIRFTGSMKFEVYDKENCILSGVLEMSNSNGFVGESRSGVKRWSMNCQTEMSPGCGFFKGKHVAVPELPCPEIEVYVAGCFSGTPIILTKTLQLNCRKKHNRKFALDSIPEYGTTECQKDVSDHGLDLQVVDYRSFKPEQAEDYNSMYCQRTIYVDEEDGELSWFNAGVRVGVGIGLGLCVGVGIGVSLLVRSYQATTRNFKRRFI
ncbi:uncharacterized protein At1g01500-like [Glycine soja]|uniref:Erythronate-4-phosphate dehydrogenase family protein n=1 Tax=Glycine soja TaxID=3848 RepID=A0A445GBR7_GLYSO|nr:uncharacterized protein At1g01500-like [Glycine soja]XP_028208992.1 uncharacterized protein At1g01500-like [Glycine soja]XP_028208993.1 uncharacterized protein At1g01500-like [Glycine soja]RZB58585.1 hypothetical protein D0Y65_046946 [Glycine soja]RZB58586.1 hypothetical protein D0Y65_046946 [Glycine soja]RZB58587.1 hypothetical protein D0Y65_046946 [Glycine soja]RZB58588.1 hypothetical protein D0Y65_046946 [Glycine soja]